MRPHVHPFAVVSLALLGACAPSGAADVPAVDTAVTDTAAPDTDTAAPDTDTDTDTADTDTADTDTTDTDTDTPAPSRGDLSPAASVAMPRYALASAAVDLDGDGRDEVLVEDWQSERLHIGRLDARAGTAVLEEGPVFADMTAVFSVGNAQVIVQRSSGSELVALTREDDGTWSATRAELSSKAMAARPVGDLDGDGVNDAVIQFVRDAWVVRGPVDPDLPEGDRILDITDYDDGNGRCLASADLDGDGADDLLSLSHVDETTLQVVYGPLSVGTVGTLASLAETAFPVDDGSCGLGVVDDLDGDGAREIVIANGDILVYDGVGRGTTAAEPERVIERVDGSRVAPGLAPVLSAVGPEVGWWYTLPAPADYRPDASVSIYNEDLVVYGRFGSADAIDVAWTEAASLHAVLGFEAPAGRDLDRDGWAAEDCDDADPALRPGAPDGVDGVDSDCDGAVDEAPAVALVPVLSWAGSARGHGLGRAFVAWGPSHLAARNVTGAGDLLVADLAAGTTAPFDLLEVSGFRPTPYAAGDLDGDGHADLGVYGSAGDGGVFYGPVAAAEGVSFSAALDGYTAAAGVGDLDGDGYGELVATGTWYASTGEPSSRAVLLPGQAARDGAFAHTLLHESVRTHVALGPIDLDGDGYDDLLLHGSDGATFWLGPLASVPAATNASGTFTGSADDASLHPGDLDGDGAPDLIVGAPDEDRVGVSFGPWSAGTWDLTTPDLAYTGPAGSHFGAAVAWVAGEWLFVGAPEADRAAGAAYGFPLDTPASAHADGAAGRVDGLEPGASVGTALLLGDPDGDAALDLLVGAPGETAPLDDEGTLRRYPVPASP